MLDKRVVSTVMTICVFAASASADVPLHINHQGSIAVNGERFTGQGDFWFAIVDPNGTNLWTNDGSRIGEDAQPDSAASLVVVNGIYSVELGGGEMAPIDSSVFSTDDVALRIWFDDGTDNGIHQLIPDQPIASVPFAYHSATIADNSVNSAKIENRTITADDLASDSVGHAEIAKDAVRGEEIKDDTVSAFDLASDADSLHKVSGGAMFSNGRNIDVGIGTLFVDADRDRVGIGTTDPSNTLDVAGAAVIGASYSGSIIAPSDGLLVEGNVGIGTTTDPEARLHVVASDNLGLPDIGQFFAKNLSQGIGIGHNSIQAIGSNLNQDIVLLPKGTDGNVGIGTNNPSAKLDVAGTTELNGTLTVNATSGNASVVLPNSSISAVETLDEPGVAARFSDRPVDLTASFTALLSRNINAPAPGYVLAIASVEVWLNPNTESSSSCNVGLSTSESSVQGGLIFSGSGTEFTVQTITVNHVFQVDSSGDQTIYLVAKETGPGASSVRAMDYNLVLVYLPTAYGTVTASEDEGAVSFDDGDASDFGSIEATNQPESLHDGSQAIIERLKAEKNAQIAGQAQQIADLNARIQRIEAMMAGSDGLSPQAAR